MSERPQPKRPARHLELVKTQREEIDFGSLLDVVDQISDSQGAEIVGATWWASAEVLGSDLNENILRLWCPACETVATVSSAAMLAVLAPFSHPIVATALADALERLAATGVRPPRWADELAVAPTIRDCVELRPMDGDPLLLAARFDRLTAADSVLILLGAFGVADQIMILGADELPDALREAHDATDNRLTQVPLTPSEFRDRVEYALAARTQADVDDPPVLDDVVEGGDQPSYYTLVELLRARLRELP